jgi:hypothetical protein
VYQRLFLPVVVKNLLDRKGRCASVVSELASGVCTRANTDDYEQFSRPVDLLTRTSAQQFGYSNPK